MSHLVGVRVFQEYRWEYRGVRHIAVHGHQFDGFVVSNVRVSYLIGTLLYLQLQKWDSKNKTLTRFFDRLNTRWLRLSAKVAAGALAHARHHQAARIFCGHTHAALHKHDDEHGIDYFNCGAWIDAHPHTSPWVKTACGFTSMWSGLRISHPPPQISRALGMLPSWRTIRVAS